jgi:hypothetical protein
LNTGRDIILSQLDQLAQPAAALASTPTTDRWVVLPYEGPQFNGSMLWAPSRSKPPEIRIPLPAVGPCRIHLGIYGSATWPYWFNLIGVYGQHTRWCRLRVRLSDQPGFEDLIPRIDPSQPRFEYLSEVLYTTADLRGQELVVAPACREAYLDTTALLSHVRLEPLPALEPWPAQTRRLTMYFDGAMFGHYVDSADEIAAMLRPIAGTDYDTVLWNTSREDTCYYPTRVGNVLPRQAMAGMYPYWAGEDLHRMIDRGQDPLREVCRIGHDLGLKVLATYRRMTCRMPPFTFPLHPEAMLMKRRDLWCVNRDGSPAPHLSVVHVDVRRRVVSILREQATEYDVDGVHLYLSRGLPLAFYEPAVLEEGRRRFDVDLRTLPLTDERLGLCRAPFVTTWFREIRAMLDEAGKSRGRRLLFGLHCPNTLANCLYYGIDVVTLAKEGIVDLLYPDQGHFLPAQRGDKKLSGDAVAQFVAAASGSTLRILPTIGDDKLEESAKSYYDAGAQGFHACSQDLATRRWVLAIAARLGHRDLVGAIAQHTADHSRFVPLTSVGGLAFDMESGIPTCG